MLVRVPRRHPAGRILIRPYTHPRLTGSHSPPKGVDCGRAVPPETWGWLLVIVAVAIALLHGAAATETRRLSREPQTLAPGGTAVT